MDLTIQIKSNKSEVEETVRRKLNQGLYGCGEAAEGFAKQNCPVDTGRLRNSITFEVDEAENAVYIGTNVEYAPVVEYRDVNHKTGRAHYLRDALQDHQSTYQKLMDSAMS